jgi:hypothetical protein
MTAISTIPKGSQISPVNERVYHQSNLVGDWKGTWQKSSRPVEFKVINIRGDTAQVEYTHDGHTERGIASVDGATITYGDVTIGTKDGQNAALEFSTGTAKQDAILTKQADSSGQSNVVGSWSGYSRSNGQSAYFQVVSVDGTDAQVRFSANGGTIQSGNAIVSGNAIMFGSSKATFTSTDGQNGNVVFQIGHSTYSVPVTKSKIGNATPTSTSTVNKLA